MRTVSSLDSEVSGSNTGAIVHMISFLVQHVAIESVWRADAVIKTFISELCQDDNTFFCPPKVHIVGRPVSFLLNSLAYAHRSEFGSFHRFDLHIGIMYPCLVGSDTVQCSLLIGIGKFSIGQLGYHITVFGGVIMSPFIANEHYFYYTAVIHSSRHPLSPCRNSHYRAG